MSRFIMRPLVTRKRNELKEKNYYGKEGKESNKIKGGKDEE